MSRAISLCFLTLLGLAISVIPALQIMGQGAQQPSLLLSVHQQTDLVDPADPPAVKPTPVRSGTMIIGLHRETYGEPPRPGWRVITLEETPRKGWVPAGFVAPFDTRVKELEAVAILLRQIKPGNEKKLTLPELILIQDKPVVKEAWTIVADAIAENELLPENERLPEPYFARAEIWASVKNYSDSLQDYLTALQYARRAKRDLLSFSNYFDKLYHVAGKLREVPLPPSGGEPDLLQSARRHFGHGCGQFHAGYLENALDGFVNAVQLAPDQPLYWYFRALTHRRLGDNQRALHDVLMGAHFERIYEVRHRTAVDRTLVNVQGESRIWLETFRRGSPSQRLLQLHNVQPGDVVRIR